MDLEYAVKWVIVLFPLAISPGPANVLFAASGSAFGIRGTIPFWLGTNIVCIFQSVGVGFGLDLIVSNYPQMVEFIKYIGVAFLMYLAFRFFRLTIVARETIKALKFKDGVIVEFFNIKYLMIPTIMFSQFNTTDSDNSYHVGSLAFALALLTMSSNLVWIIGGKSLTSFIIKKNAQKTQGVIFGSLLCITAIWLAIS